MSAGCPFTSDVQVGTDGVTTCVDPRGSVTESTLIPAACAAKACSEYTERDTCNAACAGPEGVEAFRSGLVCSLPVDESGDSIDPCAANFQGGTETCPSQDQGLCTFNAGAEGTPGQCQVSEDNTATCSADAYLGEMQTSFDAAVSSGQGFDNSVMRGLCPEGPEQCYYQEAIQPQDASCEGTDLLRDQCSGEVPDEGCNDLCGDPVQEQAAACDGTPKAEIAGFCAGVGDPSAQNCPDANDACVYRPQSGTDAECSLG